jgi:hypothetical protein
MTTRDELIRLIDDLPDEEQAELTASDRAKRVAAKGRRLAQRLWAANPQSAA